MPRPTPVTLPLPEVAVRGLTRDWVSFTDPSDDAHEVRADLTWLLSRWSCVFGRGCHGVVAGRAADGCCSHGAFFADSEDEARVLAAARQLGPEDWERRGLRRLVDDDELDDAPARRTRTIDGACVFLNSAHFAGGPGCALHALALRQGRHPLETKPDVCWQLPVRRTVTTVDDRVVSTLTEFDRDGWGPGGADLHWWCTSSAEAHQGAEPLYRSYGPELTALLGAAAYDRLVVLCAEREQVIRPHPATAQASNL